MMQRQISLPAGGLQSPRGQQSTYSGQQDPLMLSPHSQKLSPNSQLPQQQISPPNYSQIGMGHSPPQPQTSMAQQLGIGPQSFQGGVSAQGNSGAPMGNLAALAPGFDQQQMFAAGMGQDRKNQLSLGSQMQMATNSKSQFVKQELRALCNTRQTQQMTSIQDPQLMDFDGGELPAEIVDAINEIQQQQQQQQSVQPNPPASSSGAVGDGLSSIEEESIVNQSREEARRRYEKFKALAFNQGVAPGGGGGGGGGGAPPPQSFLAQMKDLDDPEIKATTLFRNQLLSVPVKDGSGKKSAGLKIESQQVSVVQSEPRAPIDDIKPADQKNSLLQQLLSE